MRDKMKTGKAGSLTRASALITGSGKSSVFTLEHWSKNVEVPSQSQFIIDGYRSFKSIIKFIFWRWLTWTNVFELVLILILLTGCVYQCYEPLSEYYNYPTYVSVKKIMNDNFKNDLPAITLCNKNRVSKEALRKRFPKYNISHFLAITMDTFRSLDDWYLPEPEEFFNPTYDEGLYELHTLSTITADLSALSNCSCLVVNRTTSEALSAPAPEIAGSSATAPTKLLPAIESAKGKPQPLTESAINWAKVTKFLGDNTARGTFDIVPSYDIIANLACANIWGDNIACDKLARIESIQDNAFCVTLFHSNSFHDPKAPGVRELDLELMNQKTDIIQYADNVQGDDSGLEIFEFDTSLSSYQSQSEMWDINEELNQNEEEELKERVVMGTREVIRLKLNFSSWDYADSRQEVGGIFSVHSNSHIGAINHIKHFLEPGYWYNHYVERFDYERLPAPYNTRCYNYSQFRHIWLDKQREFLGNLQNILKMIHHQAEEPKRLLPEYAESIRQRSAGSTECRNMCRDEMSVAKCKCWIQARPYVKDNFIDINGSFPWCDLNWLLADKGGEISEVAGDDLHLQLCLKDYSDLCMNACPGECDHSTFDVTQQARAWPSAESMTIIGAHTIAYEYLSSRLFRCCNYQQIYLPTISHYF